MTTNMRPSGALEGHDWVEFRRPFRAQDHMGLVPGTATALAVLSPANVRRPFGTKRPTLVYEQLYSTENSEEPRVIPPAVDFLGVSSSRTPCRPS